MNLVEYFLALPVVDKVLLISGAILGVILFFGISWLFALGCVAIGYGQEICGI